jgi:hypothetical protein
VGNGEIVSGPEFGEMLVIVGKGTVGFKRAAEHDAFVPPLLPAQPHDHGPVPVRAEAVPVVQRPDAGAVLTVVPLAAPHAPFTLAASDADV